MMPHWNVSSGGVRMLRPDWYEFTRDLTGILLCACGLALWDQGSTRTHWQMGHFDRPADSEPVRVVSLWETA